MSPVTAMRRPLVGRLSVSAPAGRPVGFARSRCEATKLSLEADGGRGTQNTVPCCIGTVLHATATHTTLHITDTRGRPRSHSRWPFLEVHAPTSRRRCGASISRYISFSRPSALALAVSRLSAHATAPGSLGSSCRSSAVDDADCGRRGEVQHASTLPMIVLVSEPRTSSTSSGNVLRGSALCVAPTQRPREARLPLPPLCPSGGGGAAAHLSLVGVSRISVSRQPPSGPTDPFAASKKATRTSAAQEAAHAVSARRGGRASLLSAYPGCAHSGALASRRCQRAGSRRCARAPCRPSGGGRRPSRSGPTRSRRWRCWL